MKYESVIATEGDSVNHRLLCRSGQVVKICIFLSVLPKAARVHSDNPTNSSAVLASAMIRRGGSQWLTTSNSYTRLLTCDSAVASKTTTTILQRYIGQSSNSQLILGPSDSNQRVRRSKTIIGVACIRSWLAPIKTCLHEVCATASSGDVIAHTSDEADCVCEREFRVKQECSKLLHIFLVAPRQCTSNEFRCVTDGKCIRLLYRCNGENDCDDSSDEMDNCTTSGKHNGGVHASFAILMHMLQF